MWKVGKEEKIVRTQLCSRTSSIDYADDWRVRV